MNLFKIRKKSSCVQIARPRDIDLLDGKYPSRPAENTMTRSANVIDQVTDLPADR